MWAKQSTAATLIVGPILDSSGAEYASAVIGDLSISKNGGTLTALAAAATLTHISNGQYTLVMTTGNLDTLGRLQITCNKSTYQMPPVGLNIVPADRYDSLVLGTDRFDANVTHVADTAQTARDIGGNVDVAVSTRSTFAGGAVASVTGDVGGNVVGSVGSVVGVVALDSAARVKLDATQPDYAPATAAALAAAKTILDKVDTGLVVDGAVYQFTANMLELGPAGGGGSTVNVLPATGIVADRSAGTTLNPVVGETISQSITVYQSDGTTAVSLSGKTLKVIFETMSGVDVAVVLAADITISGASSNVVTFAYPSAVTASERTLRFAIRDAAAPLTMYLQGVCSVIAAPKVDA